MEVCELNSLYKQKSKLNFPLYLYTKIQIKSSFVYLHTNREKRTEMQWYTFKNDVTSVYKYRKIPNKRPRGRYIFQIGGVY